MFQDLDNKQKAYGTLGIFVAIALIFWLVSDSFAVWSATSNSWLVLLVSIIINPSYALLIYWLYKNYQGRGIISGILISIAFDIMSLTHSIRSMGGLPTSEEAMPLYGYSDTLFYKEIIPFIQGTTGVFVLYVIIPVALIYLALRVIRRTSSFNKIMKEAI